MAPSCMPTRPGKTPTTAGRTFCLPTSGFAGRGRARRRPDCLPKWPTPPGKLLTCASRATRTHSGPALDEPDRRTRGRSLAKTFVEHALRMQGNHPVLVGRYHPRRHTCTGTRYARTVARVGRFVER